MNETPKKETGKGSGHAGGEHGQGRLFQRGKVWWVQYYVLGVRVRESSHSRIKDVAKKLLMKRLVATDEGTLSAPAKAVTYEDMRKRYVAKQLLDKPHLTAKDTDYVLKRLDEFFGGLRASVITEDKVDQFKLACRDGGLSTATINNALGELRRMFKHSRKDVRVPPEITDLPDPPARKGFLTRVQYERLYAALPDYLRPITAYAHYTGMRRGELEAITWRNVDLDERMIRLEADQTKNEEERYVPFGKIPELIAVMEQLAKDRRSDHVFCRPDGSPLACYRKAWNRACIKAGLGRMCWRCPKYKSYGKAATEHPLIEVVKQPWPPERPPEEKPHCACGAICIWHYEGLIFHDLRRTAVRNLRRAGVPESVAMKISGHKTREVFERYNIKDQRDVIEAMEKLSEFTQSEDEKLKSRPN